jgi:hypothetical protein
MERACLCCWGRDDDEPTFGELPAGLQTLLRARAERGRSGGLPVGFGLWFVDPPALAKGTTFRRFVGLDPQGPLDTVVPRKDGTSWPAWRWLRELARGLSEEELRNAFDPVFTPAQRVELACEIARGVYALPNEGLVHSSPRSSFALRWMNDAIAGGAQAPSDVDAIRERLGEAE